MADIKRRFSVGERVELRETEDGTGKIRGVAAVYYDPDDPGTEFPIWKGAVERIHQGAFSRGAAEDDVIACFNHDPSQLLGRTTSGTLRLVDSQVGLGYECDLGQTRAAQDIKEHVARGDVTGSSFAFSIQDGGDYWSTETRDGEEIAVRNITDVRLYDVSPVTTPAYASTTVGLRSEDYDEARASLDAYRKQQAADSLPEPPKEDWRTYRARIAQHGL